MPNLRLTDAYLTVELKQYTCIFIWMKFQCADTSQCSQQYMHCFVLLSHFVQQMSYSQSNTCI